MFEELYDLKNDPHETVNLVQNSGYQDVLKQMREKCDELYKASK